MRINTIAINNEGVSQIDFKRVKYIPIILLELYLIGVLILYSLGPWKWPTNNVVQFYLLILSYYLALALGYFIAVNIKCYVKEIDTKKIPIKILYIIISLSFIMTILNFLYTIGINSLNFKELLQIIITGIKDPSSRYYGETALGGFGGAYFTYAYVLTAPFLWPAIPLGLYFFKNLNLFYKIFFILTITIEAARWIAIGTSKGIIDIILIIIAVLFLKFILKITRNRKNQKPKIAKYGFVIIAIILCVIATTVFLNNTGDRVEEEWRLYSLSTGGVPIDYSSPIMKICPDSFKPAMVYVSSYLTQGYYGFSLAFDLDNEPMLGIGNSMFLIENFSEIFNRDYYSKTYQAKMERFNWDKFSNWHSIYVWFANDVGIYGVIFIMMLLGALFAKVYKEAILYKDSLAIVLFCLLGIMFFYFPANNQILSYPSTFMTFWALLLFWIGRRYIRGFKSGEKVL